MAYTRDDYIKDIYLRDHAEGPEKAEAKFRIHLYEVGRTSKIEEAFPEFSDSPVNYSNSTSHVEDYWDCSSVSDCFLAATSSPVEKYNLQRYLRFSLDNIDKLEEEEATWARLVYSELNKLYQLHQIYMKCLEANSQYVFARREELEEGKSSFTDLLKRYKVKFHDARAAQNYGKHKTVLPQINEPKEECSTLELVGAVVFWVIIILLFVKTCS